MSRRYDTLVIGAGHNGLAAAALLAKRGRPVLVVERRPVVGGCAAPEEFHPGFRSAGLHADATTVWPGIVPALALERHGLKLRERRPDVLGLDSGILLRGDPLEAAREIRSVSPADADRYLEYRRFLHRIRAPLRRLLQAAPPELIDPGAGELWQLARRALALRRLGAQTLTELARVPSLALRDWLGEWFESEALQALLALPALAGTFAGPRSPGTTSNLLRLEALAAPGPAGGGPALVAALEAAGRAHGAQVRTGCGVRRVVVESGRVRGVELDDGERIEADRVAASCDPKRLLLELLAPGTLSSRLTDRIRRYRARGTTAHVRLALARPPRFAARPDEPIEFARSGARLDDLERAFDAIKYRATAAEPILDVHVPSASLPALAPPGAAVVSVQVHFVPYDLAAGWSDGERGRLADHVVARLERHAPGLAGTVLGREVLVPVDLEERYGLTGGCALHGEHALDQLLVRPTAECARYATPLPGLWLCGSGSHPGGGLTCLPGALAAGAILSARRGT